MYSTFQLQNQNYSHRFYVIIFLAEKGGISHNEGREAGI